MSKGNAHRVTRYDKATIQRLEYVASKPMLWSLEARHVIPRLTKSERIKYRHWLFWKYGAECAYCQRPGDWRDGTVLTIDHIMPVCAGGAMRDIRNMVLACVPCNKAKGSIWPYLR